MRSYDKQRDAISKTVRDFRLALGKTQQQFAVEVMKTAIGTVAVWETSRPPKAEALWNLAEAASRTKQFRFARQFLRFYFDYVLLEIPGFLAELRMVDENPDDYDNSPNGYVFCRFQDGAQAKAAVKALRKFASRIAEIVKDTDTK